MKGLSSSVRGLWSIAAMCRSAQTFLMTTFARPRVHDELQSVVSALCTRYPTRSRTDIENVVAEVYAELAANAKVTAHLIPLTLNRSRRVLEARNGSVAPEKVLTVCAEAEGLQTRNWSATSDCGQASNAPRRAANRRRAK
jgi:hypothetical protein